jgi:hypothetical protein
MQGQPTGPLGPRARARRAGSHSSGSGASAAAPSVAAAAGSAGSAVAPPSLPFRPKRCLAAECGRYSHADSRSTGKRRRTAARRQAERRARGQSHSEGNELGDELGQRPIGTREDAALAKPAELPRASAVECADRNWPARDVGDEACTALADNGSSHSMSQACAGVTPERYYCHTHGCARSWR